MSVVGAVRQAKSRDIRSQVAEAYQECTGRPPGSDLQLHSLIQATYAHMHICDLCASKVDLRVASDDAIKKVFHHIWNQWEENADHPSSKDLVDNTELCCSCPIQ